MSPGVCSAPPGGVPHVQVCVLYAQVCAQVCVLCSQMCVLHYQGSWPSLANIPLRGTRQCMVEVETGHVCLHLISEQGQVCLRAGHRHGSLDAQQALFLFLQCKGFPTARESPRESSSGLFHGPRPLAPGENTVSLLGLSHLLA